jgi:hypothetical protein
MANTAQLQQYKMDHKELYTDLGSSDNSDR